MLDDLTDLSSYTVTGCKIRSHDMHAWEEYRIYIFNIIYTPTYIATPTSLWPVMLVGRFVYPLAWTWNLGACLLQDAVSSG
jgi:hypothetical protein